MTPKTEPYKCPLCDGSMKERNGPNGKFHGCAKFPACRGTRNADGRPPHNQVNAVKYDPIVQMPGSDEQEAIWEYQLNGTSHMVVNAGPGTGKTWTQIQYCLRAPKTKKILFVAFNRHIAAEANGKLGASGCDNVRACTYHSLGYGILRQHFKTLGAPDENKMQSILEDLSPMPLYNRAEWRRALNLADKLAGLVKNYLLDYRADNFADEIERIADHHGIDMNGSFGKALDLVPPALDKCKKRAGVSVDWDDMIWLPVVLNLDRQERCDVMITDESQDLNTVQHELAMRTIAAGRFGKSGRAVIVGDRHQAIYGFRGALTTSIEALAARLGATERGVREFPLTITRRCPKSHVRLAQALFPNIQALPDAPEGEILEMCKEVALAAMKPGDLVICRVNAELIRAAYALIRRGIRPVVKGRDIGKGLLALIDTLEKMTGPQDGPDEMQRLHIALSQYRYEKESKLLPLGDKAQGRIGALHDKCDCLLEFISNSDSVVEMRAQIEALFSDQPDKPSNAVTLGTVHRTKGMEAERVFVLAPDLIPHPMAKKPWELDQEKNLAWVAATRALFSKDAPGTLIFCGMTPPLYKYNPTTPPDLWNTEDDRADIPTISMGGKVGDTKWVRSAAQRACQDTDALKAHLEPGSTEDYDPKEQ